MKILAFSDIHDNPLMLKRIAEASKKEKPDLLVCTGDLSMFESNLEYTVKKLDAIGIETLVIHGNHEEEDSLAHLCKKSKNVKFLHKKLFRKGDVLFFGFGGGGFSKKELDLEEFVNKYKGQIKDKDKVVFLTHAPPYGTKLDVVPGFGHVGCKSTSDFAKKGLFDFILSGHIHDSAGKTDVVGKAKAYNLSLQIKPIKIQ